MSAPSEEKKLMYTMHVTPLDGGSAKWVGLPATDEEILAQPCVVEALRKAREESQAYRDGYSAGRKAGWEQGFNDACRDDDD